MNDNEGLSRYMSPVSAWAFSFGCAVGWGAFVMPGTTFLPMAGPMGTTLGLFIGALIMLILGRNYHYLMQRYQGSGGSFTFVRKTFGNDHGFLTAWFLVLTYVAIVWANVTALALIVRNVFGDILQFGFHYQLAGYDIYAGEVLFELIVLALCALVVAFRKKLAGVIQTILAIVLISGIVVGFILVLRNVNAQTTVKPLFQPDSSAVTQVFNIITLAPWAFIGFESVSHSSREFKFNSGKTFLILALAITTGYFAYTFLNDMAVLAHPSAFADWHDYISNLGEVSGRASMPVFSAVHIAAGDVGVIILTVTVFAGILTGIIGNTVASSRLVFAMSRNGILPEWFKEQAKDTTPKNAVIFIAIVSAVMPFFGRTAIGWIVDVTSIGAVIAYGYTSAVAYKCAKEEGSLHVKITGCIGVVLAVLFAAFLMIPNLVATNSLSAESYLILTIWSILGFLFFRYVFKKDSERRFGQSTVVWIVLLFIIFFTSLMWMRQQTNSQVSDSMNEINEYYTEAMIDAGMKEKDVPKSELREFEKKETKEIEDTMTYNSIVQMVLIVVSLIIMISVYTLIIRRSRQYEMEKIKAEESSHAKSTFLSNMSHDIRTPMNSIIGYVKLAKKEDITLEEMQGYMDKIEGSSQHLLALINDVLEMSRIESGKMELVEIPADLRNIIKDIDDMFRTQMSEKHIDYVVEAVKLEHPFVYCDRNRLNRVLLNLVSNAFKFTPEEGNVSVILKEIPEGSVSGISIPMSEQSDGKDNDGDIGDSGTLRETPENNSEEDQIEKVNYGFYELRVKDSGIGMSPEFAARVFESFERERTSTVSGIQGTGLGMAITKSIVDLMGGTIEVKSNQGEGTEFITRLPLRLQSESETADKPNNALSNQVETEVDFTGKRVLLVDDMDINREIAKMMLEQMGFTVFTAVNGEEAVRRVHMTESGHYDVVLMDIQMPVMDGYEATATIRALDDPEQSSIPIIAMTANAFSEDIKKAHDVGMNAHVAKPIDLNKLISAFNEVLK
ncbi:MAG: amino acid permease [Eubacterium sp.]|nr:amino acid permease [Eubacterium sp.]